jgi:hypothetical protein
MDSSRAIIPVELVVPVPNLSTILIYESRPIVPVNLVIPVPILITIWIYNSRSIFPVIVAKVISKSIMVMLKPATGFEDR